MATNSYIGWLCVAGALLVCTSCTPNRTWHHCSVREYGPRERVSFVDVKREILNATGWNPVDLADSLEDCSRARIFLDINPGCSLNKVQWLIAYCSQHDIRLKVDCSRADAATVGVLAASPLVVVLVSHNGLSPFFGQVDQMQWILCIEVYRARRAEIVATPWAKLRSLESAKLFDCELLKPDDLLNIYAAPVLNCLFCDGFSDSVYSVACEHRRRVLVDISPREKFTNWLLWLVATEREVNDVSLRPTGPPRTLDRAASTAISRMSQVSSLWLENVSLPDSSLAIATQQMPSQLTFIEALRCPLTSNALEGVRSEKLTLQLCECDLVSCFDVLLTVGLKRLVVVACAIPHGGRARLECAFGDRLTFVD